MVISSFQLHNYKSFKDSPKISFSPGFNVIVGQNNVGKSALLEALGLQFVAKPHRSLLSAPSAETRLKPNSSAEVSFILERDEFRQILRDNLVRFKIPMPSVRRYQQAQQGLNQLLDVFFEPAEVEFEVGVNSAGNTAEFVISKFPTFGKLYEIENPSFPDNTARFVEVRRNADGTWQHAGESRAEKSTDFGLSIAQVVRQRIYSFHAHRYIVGTSPFGPNQYCTRCCEFT